MILFFFEKSSLTPYDRQSDSIWRSSMCIKLIAYQHNSIKTIFLSLLHILEPMIHKSRLLLRIYDIEEQAQKKDTRHDENTKKKKKKREKKRRSTNQPNRKKQTTNQPTTKQTKQNQTKQPTNKQTTTTTKMTTTTHHETENSFLFSLFVSSGLFLVC